MLMMVIPYYLHSKLNVSNLDVNSLDQVEFVGCLMAKLITPTIIICGFDV